MNFKPRSKIEYWRGVRIFELKFTTVWPKGGFSLLSPISSLKTPSAAVGVTSGNGSRWRSWWTSGYHRLL